MIEVGLQGLESWDSTKKKNNVIRAERSPGPTLGKCSFDSRDD